MKDGGPSFPSPVGIYDGKTGGAVRGITLRDYFAAKALQGLLAHPDCMEVGPAHEDITNGVVSEAYFVADAMLRARQS